MKTIRTLLQQYACALRDEPQLRAYTAASFIDDIGLAIAAWAAVLLQTNLFETQRARAQLMLPTLACFLVGTVVSGPLADWTARQGLQQLARWRWRLVVWARLAETCVLGCLTARLAAGPPTISALLPFMMLTAFTKTALRPTRIAFAVDLLRCESPQCDHDGKLVLDEQAEPLMLKTHLLAATTLIDALNEGVLSTISARA